MLAVAMGDAWHDAKNALTREPWASGIEGGVHQRHEGILGIQTV